jgi:hypothetical protein
MKVALSILHGMDESEQNVANILKKSVQFSQIML